MIASAGNVSICGGNCGGGGGGGGAEEAESHVVRFKEDDDG